MTMSELLAHAAPADRARLAAIIRIEAEMRDAARLALIASGEPAGVLPHLLRWHGSAERPRALLDLVSAMRVDGAAFWRLVVEAWSGFDRIPHRDFAAAFRNYRSAWSPDAMGPADRAAFDALPAQVTIYRGQSAQAAPGLAWSLVREVATGFAMGHRGIRVPSPAVLKTTVRRSSIAFVCTDRNEVEVVLFRKPALVQVKQS